MNIKFEHLDIDYVQCDLFDLAYAQIGQDDELVDDICWWALGTVDPYKVALTALADRVVSAYYNRVRKATPRPSCAPARRLIRVADAVLAVEADPAFATVVPTSELVRTPVPDAPSKARIKYHGRKGCAETPATASPVVVSRNGGQYVNGLPVTPQEVTTVLAEVTAVEPYKRSK